MGVGRGVGGAPPLLTRACTPSLAPARGRRYVLKNLVRDWAEEGAAERAQSYGRILDELRRLLGPSPAERRGAAAAQAAAAGALQQRNDRGGAAGAAADGSSSAAPGSVAAAAAALAAAGGSEEEEDVAGASGEWGEPPIVLVPGAGLGRLCLEIASLVRRCLPAWRLAAVCGAHATHTATSLPHPLPPPPHTQGYGAQGNEFSYYMLLASSFILNQTQRPEQARGDWVVCSVSGSWARVCTLHCPACDTLLVRRAFRPHACSGQSTPGCTRASTNCRTQTSCAPSACPTCYRQTCSQVGSAGGVQRGVRACMHPHLAGKPARLAVVAPQRPGC